MKIIIGGQDYTSALDAVHPLTIERKLNEPSVCSCWITLPRSGELPAPGWKQSIRVVGDDGRIYFTGYLADTPVPEYAGVGIAGPRYRLAVRALSDEYLLDQIGVSAASRSAGVDAGALLASIVEKTGSSALSCNGLLLDVPLTRFDEQQGMRFSSIAARLASQARTTYRALDGALSLASIPAAVHGVHEGEGSLSLNENTRRALANDITVCGEHEPADYVTEFFQGDGVTTQFYLAERPYGLPSSKTTIIRELFNEGELDGRFWATTGIQGYLTLGSGGLQMQGGRGKDGDVQLTWRDPVEMGGTLLLEAGGVTLANGSSGTLAAFLGGDGTERSCTAGFTVTAEQGSGAVSVQPMVLGIAAGSAYSIDSANQYSLRLRVHCAECERGNTIYRSFGDAGQVSAGGEWSSAPAKALFEIQEYVNGVAGMPVTLYDGQIAALPGFCSVVAASSEDLHGSIRSVNLMDLGSTWVVTTSQGGSPITRRMGSPAQAAECRVDSSGTLVFYPGFAPRAGEQVQVSYRSTRRAVGRAVNVAEQAELAQQGLPATAAWVGSVVNPAPRSSQDCRNAALVLAQAAASASALWKGRYDCTSASLDADVWPGDALQINAPSAALDVQLIVRAVKMTYASSYPDLVHYAITFANDWAEDLAIKTSDSIPEDAVLPAQVSPPYAPTLSGLTVTSISGGTVTIDTGTTAPAGGGFEVRRRDNCFMPGTDPDLVMRGAEPTMSFIRGSASDRFYIRMFDSATPPNYSEFSAVLIFNTPLGS